MILRVTNLLPPPDHSKDFNLVEYLEMVVFKVALVYLRLAQKCDKIVEI